MSEVEIRPAVAADAAELAPLHLQVWNEAYTGLMDPEVLAARTTSPLEPRVERWRGQVMSNTVYVAVRDGRVIGWAQAGPGRDPGDAGLELMSLYVAAEHHGSGVGHRLLVSAIGDAQAYLWVFDGNERAIGFYERHGFRFDGTTKLDPPYGVERRMVRPTRSELS